MEFVSIMTTNRLKTAGEPVFEISGVLDRPRTMQNAQCSVC